MKKKILLLCLATLLFVTGCGTGGNEVTGGNELHEENEKLTDKVSSEVFQGANGKLIVITKNSNNQPVDITVEVEFYDENNTFIASAKEYEFSVVKDKEVALEIYDTPENFSTYKVYTDATKSYGVSMMDKVEMTHSNNGKEIVVQVKNNAETVIDSITVAVVYYKDNKVVGYEYDLETDVKAGRSANFALDYPTDKNYRDVSFDTYKVFLNRAESYTN